MIELGQFRKFAAARWDKPSFLFQLGEGDGGFQLGEALGKGDGIIERGHLVDGELGGSSGE